MVIGHTLFSFGLLKCVCYDGSAHAQSWRVWWAARQRHPVRLSGGCPCVAGAVGLWRWVFLSFLVFFFVVLSVTDSRILKSPTIVEFSFQCLLHAWGSVVTFVYVCSYLCLFSPFIIRKCPLSLAVSLVLKSVVW